MHAAGIRISDNIDRVVSVTLPDILEQIHAGNLLHWSILYLQATGHLGEGQSIPVFEEQIINAAKGFFITWNDLYLLSKKFHQTIDIILIGCEDETLLHRYENDQEMYETCDIVISMIDSSYWEIFSKNPNLINRLATKFREIEFLEPNLKK